jgi:hypothetical protein
MVTDQTHTSGLADGIDSTTLRILLDNVNFFASNFFRKEASNGTYYKTRTPKVLLITSSLLESNAQSKKLAISQEEDHCY